jgi:hypothetical protein
MSILTKKIFYLTVLAVLLSSSQYLFANVKYWFAGRMIISGNSDLTYTICHWSNTQKKMIQSPLTLSTNTEIDLAALAGGSDYCMKNNLEGTDVGCLEMQWFGTLGTGFILVPNLAFTDFAHPENEPAFQNDLRAGKFAPYIVVERQEGFINIYIVGPTNVSKFVAQKLSFDMKAFENKWINQAYWQPDKLFFAFSFNATTGTFRYSPSKQLSNDAFYIAAPGETTSFLYQQWRIKSQEVMSMGHLQNEGIIQHQGPFINNIDDLQGVINFINWSGCGNFENVK